MYDLAVDFLDAITLAMETTPAGAPDASYIVLGEPAWASSCAQAVVQIGMLGEGATSPSSPPEATGQRFERGRVNLVTLVGYAMRCQPILEGNGQNVQLPTTADLQAAAKKGYEDGWAIWNYITRLLRKDELFEGPCSIDHFDGGTPFTPEAGLGGWKFVMRVELQGYDPTP